jgi:hypothetical protein
LEECDDLDLLKLEGQYLTFIAETHTELNLLEHLESCPTCRERVKNCIRRDVEDVDYGSLFQWDLSGSTAPSIKDYTDLDEFMSARIRWRKRNLMKLLESAEVEVESLKLDIAA